MRMTGFTASRLCRRRVGRRPLLNVPALLEARRPTAPAPWASGHVTSVQCAASLRSVLPLLAPTPPTAYPATAFQGFGAPVLSMRVPDAGRTQGVRHRYARGMGQKTCRRTTAHAARPADHRQANNPTSIHLDPDGVGMVRPSTPQIGVSPLQLALPDRTVSTVVASYRKRARRSKRSFRQPR